MTSKANVLLIGSGGVGTMGAYALESGGKAAVTAVLRSNYKIVEEKGFKINSIEHGSDIEGFKPTTIRKTVPDVVAEGLEPFDYIVVATKNVPDIKPNVIDIIASAVTPGHTAILLLQNGLNIEKPLIEAFPTNPILSGVSFIGAAEVTHGSILHDDEDRLKVGPYKCPGVSSEVAEKSAKRFVEIYSACGKVACTYDEDVPYSRWRKLVYNATFNSIATILRMDVCRMRMYEHVIDELVRPAMLEVMAIALATGVHLDSGIPEFMITMDPNDTFFKPSMQQDIEKGNYIEYENIVGEPMREAIRLGVPAPTLIVIYGLCKALQKKVMEERGLVEAKFTEKSRYV